MQCDNVLPGTTAPNRNRPNPDHPIPLEPERSRG